MFGLDPLHATDSGVGYTFHHELWSFSQAASQTLIIYLVELNPMLNGVNFEKS